MKPRASSSATASASPIASCSSVEVVGASPCGQASGARGNGSTHDVASRASADDFAGRYRDQRDREAAGIGDDALQLETLARP